MKVSIPDFQSSKVLVVGDLMLDRYWHGATQRISPEAPVPVVNVELTEERAGGAGNVALNIADLQAGVTLLGLTGEDEAAESLHDLLANNGVACQFSAAAGLPTITKLRIISRHQQLIRLDFEDGFAAFAATAIDAHFRQQLKKHSVVIFSDYGKGTLANISQLIAHTKESNCMALIDPKGNDFSRYKGATLITPNQSEFEAVVGSCKNTDVIIERGGNLIEELELSALLVTRSDKGMLLLRKDAEPLNLPTHAREVFDVTGAGDTVIAMLGAALAAGCSFSDATMLANAAAGVVVGKLGTATVSLQELQAALHAHEPLQRGILAEDKLLQQISAARASGERIVFTNGCFDILHAGHVAYLAQAAELGDRLVVAVNSDESVKRLKGDDRPVNNLSQRMAVLSALECVDWVVAFSEDTPASLIASLLPDVLVKGGDYKPKDIVGADIVKRHGGEVVVLDFIDGCSTTNIINAIQKSV